MIRISFQRSERFQIKMYRLTLDTSVRPSTQARDWLLTVRQTPGIQYNITIFDFKY